MTILLFNMDFSVCLMLSPSTIFPVYPQEGFPNISRPMVYGLSFGPETPTQRKFESMTFQPTCQFIDRSRPPVYIYSSYGFRIFRAFASFFHTHTWNSSTSITTLLIPCSSIFFSLNMDLNLNLSRDDDELENCFVSAKNFWWQSQWHQIINIESFEHKYFKCWSDEEVWKANENSRNLSPAVLVEGSHDCWVESNYANFNFSTLANPILI